jgi:hypothetical protein
MPAGRGEEERFAAAMESGTPSVGDDGSDGLARELEIAALLRSAGPAFAPAPAAKARAKQRLMAAFAEEHGAGHADDTGPIAVTTSVALADRPQGRHAEPTPLRARAGGRTRSPRRGRRTRGRDGPRPVRPAPAPGPARAWWPPPGGAAGCGRRRGAGRLAGTGTFASRDALPGDPMYGVKRVAESTGYALTFGEQAKARRHLEQAQRRLDEVEGLVTRDQTERASDAPADPTEQQLVRSTMQEFDTNANEGSRLLLSGPHPTPPRSTTSGSGRPSSPRGCRACGRRSRPRTRPTSRSRCSTGCSARRTRCRGGVRPGRRTVPDGARRRARRATRRPADARARCHGARPDGDRTTTRARCGRADDRRTTTAVGGRRAVRSSDDSDDDSTDDRRRDGSGGSGGSGGRGRGRRPAAGVTVPLLPLPVKVPSVARPARGEARLTSRPGSPHTL